MELYEYFAKRKMLERGFRKAAFAKKVNMSPSKLSLVMNYERFPTAIQAYKIEKETKGSVKGWELIVKCVAAKASRGQLEEDTED